MQSVVIFDSKFGNTERIARAIGRGLAVHGGVLVVSTAEAPGLIRSAAGRPDLLFIGGPTQRRGPTGALRTFVESLPRALTGVPTAAFDTRYKGATWIMGSAAAEVTKALRKSGAPLIAPPESLSCPEADRWSASRWSQARSIAPSSGLEP